MVTDTPLQIARPPRLSRGVRVALFASLAVNVLFIGGLVSALLRHGGHWPGPQPGAQNNLGAYVSTLPAERRGAIWARVGEKRRGLGQIRRELRQARDDAQAALSAEPFDKDRFTAAQTRLIDIEHKQRVSQRDVLAEIAGSMTPEERRAFLHWRSPPRGPAKADGEETSPPKQ